MQQKLHQKELELQAWQMLSIGLQIKAKTYRKTQLSQVWEKKQSA